MNFYLMGLLFNFVTTKPNKNIFKAKFIDHTNKPVEQIN